METGSARDPEVEIAHLMAGQDELARLSSKQIAALEAQIAVLANEFRSAVKDHFMLIGTWEKIEANLPASAKALLAGLGALRKIAEDWADHRPVLINGARSQADRVAISKLLDDTDEALAALDAMRKGKSQ